MAPDVPSFGHKTIDMNTGLLSHYQAQGLRKEKKLVLGRTILKKGRFQSKYIVSLHSLRKTFPLKKKKQQMHWMHWLAQGRTRCPQHRIKSLF